MSPSSPRPRGSGSYLASGAPGSGFTSSCAGDHGDVALP